MNNKQINDILLNLVNKIKGSSYSNFSKVENKLLTGMQLCLSAIDMTYLFFELQHAFSIKFSENDLTSYKFNTLKSIKFIIKEKLEGREKL